MNKRFKDYLSSLTPKKRDLVQEALQEYMKGEAENVESLNCAKSIYQYCKDMTLLDVEHFDILMLSQNWKLIKRENICKGGLTETLADVRVIFRECLLNNATILVCVHNHPSGNINPSRTDDQLTECIRKAAQVMRIHFADHVIVGGGSFYSYREYGRI